ncbi:diaminopimelate epimerase [Thermodesulfobacteriota bacterium]
MEFSKYHALGNDYIVLHPAVAGDVPDTDKIRLLCHRNYGIGSDGILYGPEVSAIADYSLRIFNPDGSEAEKSGNGLRIFSRFLWDNDQVKQEPFTVETLGGVVVCQIRESGSSVSVDMGKVSFASTKIPVAGPPRDVLMETIVAGGRSFVYCGATVGNPHCVIVCEGVSAEEARRYGPQIEADQRFPNRTNVQFMKITDRDNIDIEIWERGAGYTLASGSSATAAAAVAHKLGSCGRQVSVHMPGGAIQITIAEDFAASMIGPVTRICRGTIDSEMFTASALQG